ncbi:MAG: BlaI/MecI/CopY family transcriptional regulator [Saprospiraceae bacterium]
MSKVKVTKAELEVLQVIWKEGPSTVRQVHNIISEKREVGYTTTLKVMQVLFEKKLLDRDTEPNSHIYSAKVAADKIQSSLLGDFVKEAFDGSTKNMVLQALGNKKVSAEELAEIKRFISQLQKKK